MPWASGRERRAIRAAVVATYGRTCHLCGLPIDGLVTIDHVIPRSAGGTDDIANLRPAHPACNYARGNRPAVAPRTQPARRYSQWDDVALDVDLDRRVVLVCGPPGAGKTTYAHLTGLAVFDRDDPMYPSETTFARAIARLAGDTTARAAVIRAGATRAARARWREATAATDTVILDTPLDECRRRIIERNRPRPPLDQQLAAAARWWQDYEPDPTHSYAPPTPVESL